MTILLCSAFVAFVAALAVVLLREVRAELWERSIEREREHEWVQHMLEVHKRWREERTLSGQSRFIRVPGWSCADWWSRP